ncbi:MAG: hypothetical protein CUN48_17855, partial [Candidatus Thermofonsia Clade 3 bacterium]
MAFLLLASALTLLHLFRRPALNLKPTIWMLLVLGWIGGGVAVLTGLLAQAYLPPQAPYRAVLNFHIWSGLATLTLYGFWLYRGWTYRSARARQQRMRSGVSTEDLLDDAAARWWVALLAIAGALLIAATGWFGGRLVYEFGVNVG